MKTQARPRLSAASVPCALAVAGLVSSCAMLGPLPPRPAPSQSETPPSHAPGSQPSPAPSAPMQGLAPQPTPAAPPAVQPRQYLLGPAAAALVALARAEERSGKLPLAAETLERALSIEPHNPHVWIELGRENILANDPTQAYGMGRKALYLASGDARAQASAWDLIAAALREQGRNNEAYAAQERAVALRRP